MKKGLLALIFCLIVVSKLTAQQSVSIGPANTNQCELLSLNAPYNGLALIIPVVNETAAVPNTVAGVVASDNTPNTTMLYHSNTARKKVGDAITLTRLLHYLLTIKIILRK